MLAQKETSRVQQQPQVKGKPMGQRQGGGGGTKSGAQNALLARQGIAAHQLRVGLEKRDLKQEAASQAEVSRQDKLYSDDKYDNKKHDDEVKDTKREAVRDDERQTDVVAREESRQNPLEQNQGQGSGSSNMGGGTQSGTGGGGMGGGGGFGGSAAAPTQAPSSSAQMSNAQIAAIEMARKIADKMSIGSVSGVAVADIQLKEGTLAGSQVRITYDRSGKVNVVFTTSDRNTARLVDHSDTRKELARQLKSKNFTLGDLVVERK